MFGETISYLAGPRVQGHFGQATMPKRVQLGDLQRNFSYWTPKAKLANRRKPVYFRSRKLTAPKWPQEWLLPRKLASRIFSTAAGSHAQNGTLCFCGTLSDCASIQISALVHFLAGWVGCVVCTVTISGFRRRREGHDNDYNDEISEHIAGHHELLKSHNTNICRIVPAPRKSSAARTDAIIGKVR
jgi:hypothetical protein